MGDIRTGIAPGATAIADRSMSIGRVLNRAFGWIGANPLLLFGLAFVLSTVPGIVLNLLFATSRPLQAGAFTPIAIVTRSGTGFLAALFVLFATGGLVRAMAAQHDGRPIGFADAALTATRKFLPLLALGVLLGLGLLVGLVLLIVPGIILYLIWSVATPALVEEQIGVFEAFGRSAFLTRGARWNIFAIQLVVLAIYWIISAISGILILLVYGMQGYASAVQNGVPILFTLLSAITSTAVLVLVTAIQTSLYVELRDWKDGPASDRLDAIFA